MSLRPDGTYRCDRCDVDIENAGLDRATTVSSADPYNPGVQRVLHLCLDRTEPVEGDDKTKKVQGCSDRVLSKRALAAYHRIRLGVTT